MSYRNRPLVKKSRRLRKAFRKQPPAWVDVIDWLQRNGHADTAGQARKIILAGRLKSESHVVGRERVKYMKNGKVVEDVVVERLQPARIRESLYVAPLPAEAV